MTRGSAIRIAYRISLRSSSSREPRYPPLKIFFSFFGCYPDLRHMKDFFFTLGVTIKPQNQPKLTLKVHKLRLLICVNDPSAGSPTDTLLRLLVVPNGRVYLFFRNIAIAVQKVHQTIRYYKRRAVCTNGRDIINASWWLALTRNSSFKIHNSKELSLTRLVLIRLPVPSQDRKYFLRQSL